METPEQLNATGLRYFQQRKYYEALGAFETAVSHPALQIHSPLAAELYNNIGVVNRFLRRYVESQRAFEQASTLFQEQNMQREFGMTLANVGDLLAKQKKRDEAAAHYASAAAVLQSAGARAEQGRVLRALSLLRLRQMRWWDAIDKMAVSLAVKPHRGLGDWLFLLLLRLALRLFMGRQESSQ